MRPTTSRSGRGGPRPESTRPAPSNRGTVFDLVHLDDDLVVVNKHAGFLTVPTDRREANTVLGALGRFLARGQSRLPRLYVVHRLDRETSGLMVFARTPAAAARLEAQFEERKALREYVAIVAGRMPAEAGTLTSHLYTDKALNQRSTARGGDRGKLAVTHYRVTAALSSTSLLTITLSTGRRNQIRVQCAEAGHPVLGDSRYSPELAAHRHWTWRRLALHAIQLGLTHPRTGEACLWRSEMPHEMRAFLKKDTGTPKAPAAPAGSKRARAAAGKR